MIKKVIKQNTSKVIPFEEKIKEVSKNVKEVLFFLISEKAINKDKIKINGELENNIKQEIEETIKERYQDINEKFSEIRKTGKDLGVLNYKLMMIPLKIKVFLATYEKKDAENLLRRMQDIEKEISKIKI